MLSAGASLFFTYYMARLIYFTLSGAIDAAHRTAGLHIGAAAFPIAACGFGCASLSCVRSALRMHREHYSAG